MKKVLLSFALSFLCLSGIYAQTATVLARVSLPYALTLDATESNLYVSTQTGGGRFVYRVNTSTGDTTTVASGFGCYGICLDEKGTGLYVGTGGSTNSQIGKLSLNGYVQSSFATGMAAPSGFTLNPSGTKLFVCDRTNYRIVSINTATGALTELFKTSGTFVISRPFGMAMDKQGRLWVTGSMVHDIAIIDTNGVLKDSIPTSNVPQIQYPMGLNCDPTGTYMYVTSGLGYIYRIKIATKEVTIFRDVTAQPALGQLYNGVMNKAGTILFVGDFSNGIIYKISLGPNAVNKEDLNEKSFNLNQNYPNPFNPATKISYTVQQRQYVSIEVTDVLGNVVAELVNEEKPAGTYTVSFHKPNLPSGIYFYKLQAGKFSETKKMILMK